MVISVYKVDSEDTYDFVNNVVPLIGLEFDFPFTLPANHPLQVCVAHALLAADPAVLQLCEVAFEEADLVLICRTRYVGSSPLDGEVVVHRT